MPPAKASTQRRNPKAARPPPARQPTGASRPPKGSARATIDAWTGGKPGPWTRDTVTELFIDGTHPGGARQVDQPGLLSPRACGGWRVDPVTAELGPAAWDPDVFNWLARARRGVGVVGPYDTRTAYFWQRTGWGGPLLGTCAPKPEPSKPPKHGGGGHGGAGGGGGGGGAQPTPSPDPTQGP